MSLRVKYIDVPPGIQAAAQVQSQGQPFADPGSVATGAKDTPYATLEPKGWPLDGKRKLLSDSPQGFWWSAERSGSNGRFQTPPTLTFTFGADYTATGITFVFWPSAGEWCSEVRITWYRGNSVLHQKTVCPDSPTWTLQHTVERFDKVRLELLKTSIPGHFAKLQRVVLGQNYWFSADELTEVQLINEADPTFSNLTVDTMQISIRDLKGRIFAPQKNQKMELYRGDRLLAAHYITAGSRQSRQQYTFSCQSAIGLLDSDYLGGIYKNTPIQTVLNDVLKGFAYELDDAFAAATVTGYLPICTRREALQQMVFAIGGMVTTQGSTAIQILPLPVALAGRLEKSHIFQGGKTEIQPLVAKVEVTAHEFTPTQEEETFLDSRQITGTDVLVTFDAPHHSYAITGGTLTGSGANWVRVTANGEVTLTGKKYLHSTARYSRQNAEATPAEQNNALTVENATLVHSGNVEEVLLRLYQISQLRCTLTQDVVVTDQQAGHKVVSENPWGEQVQGYITAMDSTLTPTGQTASITILGKQILLDAYGYAGSLYAGDKEGIVCS